MFDELIIVIHWLPESATPVCAPANAYDKMKDALGVCRKLLSHLLLLTTMQPFCRNEGYHSLGPIHHQEQLNCDKGCIPPLYGLVLQHTMSPKLWPNTHTYFHACYLDLRGIVV